MTVTNNTTQLRPSQQPRLPAAPVDYDRIYLDSLTGILRQYFNQVDNLTQSILTNTGGRFFRTVCGSFYDTTNQTAASTTTAYLITLNSTDTPNTNGVAVLASGTATFTGSITATTLTVSSVSVGTIYVGMTITGTGITANTIITAYGSGSGSVGTYTVSISQTASSTTVSGAVAQRIVTTYAGTYNLQFSIQADNANAAVQDMSIWLKQNGIDLVGSTGFLSCPAKHGSENGHGIFGWNYFLNMGAGDCLQLYWSVTSTDLSIKYYTAGTSPTRPTTSSVVATMTFVSAPLT
jgi:hypothetical protein